MIHWKRLPIALAPSEYYDKDGVYSGSGIVKDGKLYLFYTGNVIVNEEERKSYQCAAVSSDGITFEKLGPVIEHPIGYTRHVRDPKVWQEEDGSYWMILGAQTEELTGDTLLYRSEDLLNWESCGSLLQDKPELGYMWECPDLLKFNESDCFLFSPQGLPAEEKRFLNTNQTGYLVGKFSQTDHFVSVSRFQELDHGFEFYAPQTFRDGERTLLYGWAAAMPASNEQCLPTIKEGWVHALTIPREVALIEDQLIQKPAVELKQLRVNEEQSTFSLDMAKEYRKTMAHAYAELVVTFSQHTKDFVINISDAFYLKHRYKEQEIIIERKNWETGQMEQRFGFYQGTLTDLTIYLDGSMIEIFINGGRLVFTSRYFVYGSQRELIITGELGAAEGIIYPLALQ
ncbi:sucrose-6-phosphate hydrolase [Enterococcus pallens]|nr:sucrose-6-phosphate hydrolase [Enterococcus pallens]